MNSKSAKISYYVLMPASLHRGCLKCPKAIQSSNIITIYLPSKMNLLLNLISWLKFLIKLIKEEGIDFIVVGYQTPSIVLVSLLAGAITKRRVFVRFHSPIGRLPYGDQKPYKELAQELEIENNVMFLGYVDEKAKMGAIDASIALALLGICDYAEVFH